MSRHVIPPISRPPAATPSPESILGAARTRLSSWWNNLSNTTFTSYTQLPQQSDNESTQSQPEDHFFAMEALRLSKARWRTYWLAAVLCCGGALFGYDSGVIGMSCGAKLLPLKLY